MSITVLLQNLISRFLGKGLHGRFSCLRQHSVFIAAVLGGFAMIDYQRDPVPFRFFARILQTGILREVLLKSGGNGYIITGIDRSISYLRHGSRSNNHVPPYPLPPTGKSLFPSGKRHWYFQYRSPGKQSFHR